jgi:hypothetical protein
MALFWADRARNPNVGDAHWKVRKSAFVWEGETRLNPRKLVINDDEKKKGYVI